MSGPDSTLVNLGITVCDCSIFDGPVVYVPCAVADGNGPTGANLPSADHSSDSACRRRHASSVACYVARRNGQFCGETLIDLIFIFAVDLQSLLATV